MAFYATPLPVSGNAVYTIVSGAETHIYRSADRRHRDAVQRAFLRHHKRGIRRSIRHSTTHDASTAHTAASQHFSPTMRRGTAPGSPSTPAALVPYRQPGRRATRSWLAGASASRACLHHCASNILNQNLFVEQTRLGCTDAQPRSLLISHDLDISVQRFYQDNDRRKHTGRISPYL